MSHVGRCHLGRGLAPAPTPSRLAAAEAADTSRNPAHDQQAPEDDDDDENNMMAEPGPGL
eukprot:CAMPEP_0178998004 /NCGR_PEP_ID=MMETSP0795-20121207/9290_1 /TAXON_ID=88552 /ORGANISM="Amoebophrya sp., Strain Ameob2" /LENGTH=59 /DNA_ID=CAMNT_0020690671 /DNA_START=1127 /DNA_END=1306 /DNA_ORIENTATION=+